MGLIPDTLYYLSVIIVGIKGAGAFKGCGTEVCCIATIQLLFASIFTVIDYHKEFRFDVVRDKVSPLPKRANFIHLFIHSLSYSVNTY